jgi:hypothetical protein
MVADARSRIKAVKATIMNTRNATYEIQLVQADHDLTLGMVAGLARRNPAAKPKINGRERVMKSEIDASRRKRKDLVCRRRYTKMARTNTAQCKRMTAQ